MGQLRLNIYIQDIPIYGSTSACLPLSFPAIFGIVLLFLFFCRWAGFLKSFRDISGILLSPVWGGGAMRDS